MIGKKFATKPPLFTFKNTKCSYWRKNSRTTFRQCYGIIMLTFIQEILDGCQGNIITALEFIAHQDFKIFEFKIKGVIQKSFSVSLPTEWIDAQTSDCITYIDNRPYSKYPIFSEASFSVLKDALLLNTSFVMWSANPIILSKEQCDYLNRIMQRNIAFSQMTDGITLLHYSAMHGDIDVVQMYSWCAKEAGELEVRCQGGKTPLDYARENNHLIIMSFLESQIKKLSAIQIEVTESSTTQINKPLSDTNKQHIFDSLRIFGRLKSNSLTQKLIDAALADMVFPPAFKTKLISLQLAYQANKSSAAMKSLLISAIQTYFKEEGVSLFKELLSGALVPEDWNPSLMRRLAGDEIIIIENPYVEATIQDGKIYWCINFGNQIYYRRPFYEPMISQARIQNRSWHLTWKEFRAFKDAGKRTGTVSITEERFVNAISPFVNNDVASARRIWQELRTVGVLDKKLRLSQAWYPFSNESLDLKTIGTNSAIYQHISDILQQIANNNTFQETVAAGMTIYRPARVSKTWADHGKKVCCVRNRKDPSHVTKIWDVGVSRELRDHAVSDIQLPYIADHIPSQSQIKSMCELKIQQRDQEISDYVRRNPHALRMPPYDLSNLYQWKSYWISQLNDFKSDGKGLPLWSIYITKELDDTGDTTRVCKKAQENLSFYSSVKKHIDDLKKGLKEETITLAQFIQALGAFRYMYSRMCKPISNINGRKYFIHDISFSFFGAADKSSDRREMDEFFIQEMRVFQN